MVDNWLSFLETKDDERDQLIYKQTKTGRPLGGDDFIEYLEHLTGKLLKVKSPGRPKLERK